jgi:CcmD family protein
MLLRPLRIVYAVLGLGAFAVLIVPEAASAQPSQTISGMRDFWHVFIAFGIAWVLVFAWAVAIFRRLGRVEAQLKQLAPESEASAVPPASPPA